MSPPAQPRPRPTLVPDSPPPSPTAPASPTASASADDEPGPSTSGDALYVAPVVPVDAVPDTPAPTIGPISPPKRARLSDILRGLAEQTPVERVSVGDIVAALPRRATAALLFIFAAPNAIPTPPGTSALLGLPMIYLAYQMMLRRKPWLPKVISARSMRREDFAALVNRALPLLTRAERMLRPRLLPLVSPAAEALIGAFCLILALSVALPIPLGNMLPALAVSILALAVLERDGLWVIIGSVIGMLSMVVVSGVVWAAVKSVAFLVGQAFS